MTRRSDAVPDFKDDARLAQTRRLVVSLVILFVLLSPAIRVFSDHDMAPTARWFLLLGSLIFTIVTYVFYFAPGAPDLQPAPWATISVMVLLAIALFAVGGMNWLAVLAVGAGVSGRFSRTLWPATLSSIACAAAGFGVAVAGNAGFGATFGATAIGPMAAFFAYGAGRRADMVSALRRTRADLARSAVAEERLRIARDLHDLLGHSLSLITLKAELAGRVIGTDPQRAAAEIAELESVARQSLSDVRAAVTGYRQPDLAGELESAKQLLDSAGIVSQITAPDTGALSNEVDAALAWAVREGTTNVVRHSRATRVTIDVQANPATAVAEISDNGPPADDDLGQARRPRLAQPGPAGQACLDGPVAPSRIRVGGSGLAGLAERVRSLGGELAAGAVEPQGFRLRVMVPLGSQP
jgi:two-component system, NarL family, sensor histidine kinase DesK